MSYRRLDAAESTPTIAPEAKHSCLTRCLWISHSPNTKFIIVTIAGWVFVIGAELSYVIVTANGGAKSLDLLLESWGADIKKHSSHLATTLTARASAGVDGVNCSVGAFNVPGTIKTIDSLIKKFHEGRTTREQFFLRLAWICCGISYLGGATNGVLAFKDVENLAIKIPAMTISSIGLLYLYFVQGGLRPFAMSDYLTYGLSGRPGTTILLQENHDIASVPSCKDDSYVLTGTASTRKLYYVDNSTLVEIVILDVPQFEEKLTALLKGKSYSSGPIEISLTVPEWGGLIQDTTRHVRDIKQRPSLTCPSAGVWGALLVGILSSALRALVFFYSTLESMGTDGTLGDISYAFSALIGLATFVMNMSTAAVDPLKNVIAHDEKRKRYETIREAGLLDPAHEETAAPYHLKNFFRPFIPSFVLSGHSTAWKRSLTNTICILFAIGSFTARATAIPAFFCDVADVKNPDRTETTLLLFLGLAGLLPLVGMFTLASKATLEWSLDKFFPPAKESDASEYTPLLGASGSPQPQVATFKTIDEARTAAEAHSSVASVTTPSGTYKSGFVYASLKGFEVVNLAGAELKQAV